MPNAAVKTPKTRSWLWLQGLLCGGALSLFPAASLVLAALFAPAVLAALSDRTPGKPIGKAMVMMAAASAIAPLHRFLQDSNSMDGALSIISNPATLATSWVATACGWFIVEATALISYEVKRVICNRQVNNLTTERTELEKEWDA